MDILLIDDHKIFLEGLRLLVETRLNYTVVGAFTSVPDSLEALSVLKPSLVIIDIAMPGINGIEAIPLIKQIQPELRIIALSQHSDTGTVSSAVRAGANGFVVKTDAFDCLEEAIQTVQKGLLYLTPELNDKLLSIFMKGADAKTPATVFDILSSREYEVFIRLVRNVPPKAIASELNISRNTVSIQKNIYAKN